ncbi:DUF2750 domain-containing protein [Providencia huaxiensis]|uniref:DUF2750 domain-containing protein n=1 Tax=Providencia huaxiensis TaxID=2027290 RepID=A0ABU2IT85_9GAMM|nr:MULTISPECIES: DUF2750 domain-containing protein [Providencia]MBZ3682421.1 DUF2750 domain-containing protein [Providencia rettgeri]AXH62939.1 DUF2750 domain-containing protein [Providencia huaxiensis]MDT0132271.1 DUF2750 domain-containing protein [Providencia huaxiensis]MDT1978677.1 DUF2750 domain-containing protein [Providencia huaxiensis]QLR01795.1 DUF2750 domain-containing protein [Providencia rettgeri]
MNNNQFSPNDKEIKNVHALRPYQQYTYFVGKIADWEQVWGLGDGQNIVTAWNDEKCLFLPLWPAKAYVELCLTDKWANFTPMLFTLEHLMTEILPDMHEANIKVALMMQSDGKKTLIYDAAALLADLEEECQQYK